MNFSLTWLPTVLMDAGLMVAEDNGWQSRGHRQMGGVAGVMCHHTAGARAGNMPSLRTLRLGRSDLPGPLAQLGLGRDGTFYVVAAGLCFHAGKGQWQGITDGNARFIGIEAENTGLPDDPWPAPQLKAYRQGVAAILKHIGASADMCCGHKEYAPGRKPDPAFDMAAFRADVASILAGGVTPLPTIAASSPAAIPGQPDRPTLRRGMTGAFVSQLQTRLGLSADGMFGPVTEARVRQFQRNASLEKPDGIVGPLTWAALDRLQPSL